MPNQQPWYTQGEARFQVIRANRIRNLAEACRDDFGRFAFEGFGVLLDDQQLELREDMGPFGPRRNAARDPKYHFISGGQRAGKTVFLGLGHADGNMYKRGVRSSDPRFWRNYLYKTLAIAPTTDLTLKLWQVMDELSKGASDSQWDRRRHRARTGAFLHLLKAGKDGRWPVVRYENGSRTDFRSSEGWATRLEGDQWWAATWDEWASQPDREISYVLSDTLLGRVRDHDGIIVPAAWPKRFTERHLIEIMEQIKLGRSFDKKVHFLNAEKMYFTNQAALDVERRTKSEADYKRTVKGEPAGGSAVEFPFPVTANLFSLPKEQDFPEMPSVDPDEASRWRYLSAWDLGAAHDSTVGITFRVPRVGVGPDAKARIVNFEMIRGSESLTIDHIVFRISATQRLYHSVTAVDATSFGGVLSVRALRGMEPKPLGFVARSNDKLHGNMRLAIIGSGLEMLTWAKPTTEEMKDWKPVKDQPSLWRHEQTGVEKPAPDWGLVESTEIPELRQQMNYFDRDDDNIEDDAVMAFLIGLWYIRRYWLAGGILKKPRLFDRRAVPVSYVR